MAEAAEPEPMMAEAAEPAAEPEPEPAMAEAAEPAAEPEPEPAMAQAAEPEPDSEPAAPPSPQQVMTEALPVFQPVNQSAPVEAQPEPEAAPGPAPQPAAAAAQPGIAETLIAWPSTGTSAGNGAQVGTGEEATSIIPAWQPSDAPSEARRTVSLQAMPPEAIAHGDTYPAKLTFESGPFAGRVVALPNKMVTVGRAPDNDLIVGDPATSGRHARIEVRSGAFWFSDLGSTNGTLINGEPVIEKQLSDGDVIAIGQNTIRFTLE
jgi:hypothetical protein